MYFLRFPLSLVIAFFVLFAQMAYAQHEVRILRYQGAKMKDGVVLYSDVYLPKEEGKYPTIVVRTPYGVQRPGMHQTMTYFAKEGYAVVIQDVRGRYESEGIWDPFRDEASDGYETIEWAAVQPFSNGKVASQGGSYLGHNQWSAASQKPPHLVAIFPGVASTNIYSNWLSMGGAFRLSFNYGWGVVRMPNRIMLPQYWHTDDYMTENLRYENILTHLPLENGDLESAGSMVKHYRDWIEHESYDDYWKSISDEERFDQITVPSHTYGGWFDIFVQGTVNGYVGMKNQGATQEARDGARMIVGPWGHGPSRSFGGIDFGEHADIDMRARELEFYDFHLKGIDNGLDGEKPVKIFYMGANKWRHETDWPIPGTKFTPMYLAGNAPANSVRGEGRLSSDKPSGEERDHYRYDPLLPVETVGGNNCCGTPTASGPQDQRPVERREDVLVYTSDFLDKEITIAGQVTMKLHASTDGPDTDWMIKLVDVAPDGYAMPVSEGILRAKFRNGLDKIDLLTPNEVYEFEIAMTPTANVFLPGHRIRVDITSSNFPQFDRNPNTGAPLGSSAETRVANQTIYHGGMKLSHIVLPVVEAL